MEEVTIRELRRRADNVIDRVATGGTVTVTRRGKPVAVLHPLGLRGLSAPALLPRWRHVPVGDLSQLRRDIDAVMDQSPDS